MKKFSIIAASLLAAASLNAATVAVVNGKNITDTQINEIYAPMLGGADFKTLSKEQQKQLIDQFAMQELLLEEVKKQNLEKDPLYTKALERAKEGILINVYQEKLLQSIKIDAAKVRGYYDQNKDKYVRPAAAQAKHILVASEKEAKDIINELKSLKDKALSDKFSQIAREKSIDTGSARNGGELGWFEQSAMVKPFSDAAFSLKNGEITKTPVKTNFGYHIILKEAAQAKTQIKFEEAKEGIENGLKFEELRKMMAQKGADLFKGAKVEYK